jgi:hypothetical protein
MKLTTEWLDENRACFGGREWLKDQKSIDALMVLKLLAKTDQWSWFRWLAARLMTHAQKVEWAIFCAEQVIDIYEKRHPKNTRPREAIEAAKKWLKDPSEENKKAAKTAAAAAADDDDDDAAAAAAAAAAYAAAAAAADDDAAYAAAAAAAAAADDDAAYAAAADAADAAAADAADAARQKMRKTCAKEAYRILKNLP